MINIVFPMAGRGERFAQRGFSRPKPLIDVFGEPMIGRVLSGFSFPERYIFIVRREHVALGLADVLRTIRPGAVVIPIDRVTDGPACTVLLAKQLIDNADELLIADCDSYLVWPDRWVVDWFKKRGATGGVTTRMTNDPACSYAAVDAKGWVTETREKDPFTAVSTTGPYWWRHGHDFVRHAEQMIVEDRRVRGEFYVSPVYNLHIAAGGRVAAYPLPEFWSLGTPADLEAFVAAMAPATERPSPR